MTVATYDHRELHPRGADHYEPPTLEGYPEEGDRVEIVYRSKRTGELTETTGTVEECDDMSFYRGGTTPPSYLELKVDDGRRESRELRVWGGGSYSESDIDTEGSAPAQVYTRGLVSDGHGGRTWRINGLGLLVALRAPESGVTFEVTVENVPRERLEDMEERLEKAVYKRFDRDRNAEDLLDVDVTRQSE